MSTMLAILAAWLLADFLSGVFHWIEDRYLTADMPIVGEHIAKPNDRHHAEPVAFLEGTYWTRNWTTIVPASTVAAFLFLGSAPLWLWLAFAFLTQANEIHAWAHRRVSIRFIRGLQEFGVFQSARHHMVHHKSPFDCRYCVMSDWLNWLLDGVGFWTSMEWVLLKAAGFKVK